MMIYNTMSAQLTLNEHSMKMMTHHNYFFYDLVNFHRRS